MNNNIRRIDSILNDKQKENISPRTYYSDISNNEKEDPVIHKLNSTKGDTKKGSKVNKQKNSKASKTIASKDNRQSRSKSAASKTKRTTSISSTSKPIKTNTKQSVNNKSTTVKTGLIKKDMTNKTTNINKGNISKNNILEEENQMLKEKIKHLEKIIEEQENERYFERVESKGKDYMRIELEVWKNKYDQLSAEFTESFIQMKKQLADEKQFFTEQFNNSQNYFQSQIKNLKEKYESTIDKNNLDIERLRNSNKMLTEKFVKMQKLIGK
jgi:hypothetical protein